MGPGGLNYRFLGLGDNKGIRRLGWQVVFQADNFMPGPSQRIDDLIGNAMVCEESQRYQASTANSARSRA